MRKRSTFVSGASVLTVMLALIAGPARAAEPTVVSVFRCDGSGGAVSVPADQPITLHLGGYADGTYGLIGVVLKTQTTTLTVESTPYDLSGRWSAPVYDPTFNDWVIAQPDWLLGTLAAGQTLVVTYDIAFRHPVAILFPPVGPSGANGPFVITDEGTAACAITAT